MFMDNFLMWKSVFLNMYFKCFIIFTQLNVVPHSKFSHLVTVFFKFTNTDIYEEEFWDSIWQIYKLYAF
jgi:hypothetical protein